MSTIYLISSGGKLSRKGETLRFVTKDYTSTIFPYKTDQLVFLGQVEITGFALNLLMRYHIDTVFLSRNGRFNGRLEFQEKKNVFLRQKQFDLLRDPKFCLEMARTIVAHKLHNQLTFMQRILRRREHTTQLQTQIHEIKKSIQKLQQAETLDQIRGYEGYGARNFFAVYRHSIIQDWAVFNGRSMHPPLDNVNAVLSFLYTLILYRVNAAVEIEGLDPYVGHLHALNYGKRALVFDLMEEYRTPIADTLTAALFNLGILNPDDFREVVFSSDNADYPLDSDADVSSDGAVIENVSAVLLTQNGLRKVIQQFEKRMNDEVFYQPLSKVVTYKRVIREQVKHFKLVILGEEATYQPLTIK